MGKFKEFARKCVVSKIDQVSLSELEFCLVHLKQLIYTVQEENKIRREILFGQTWQIIIYR